MFTLPQSEAEGLLFNSNDQSLLDSQTMTFRVNVTVVIGEVEVIL